MSTRPLKIGIIGCGNIGAGAHLPAWLANTDVAEVVGLADPTQASLDAAAVAAGLEADRLHLDALELIARPDVEAVDIATPQHLHRELIVAAAAAGKQILCEKPLATVPAEAAAAVEAADAAGVTLGMVHNYLYLPEVVAAQRVINSGEIGDVRTVTINFLGIVDVPGSAGYAPRWRHDAARAGGGVLMDILHGVYLAESLLGSELRRVSAYADSIDPDSNVEDLALCRFETERNAGLVNIAWGHGPGGIEVTGTEGRISALYANGGTAPWSDFERVTVTTVEGTRVEHDARVDGGADGYAALGEAFRHVFRDFADAVREGRDPRTSGADGLRILEATVGALESACTGRMVSIPLDRDDPVFREGVLGIAELDLPEWSPARRRSLYRNTATIGEQTRP
jgi:UDP-N-acetyl-2-amino-2-deoxyglucuronate dehydrogenase